MPNNAGSIVIALLSLAVTACSQSGDGSGSQSDAPLYRLSGTVATGRAGSWAEVCIEEHCSRADNEGVYRLREERSRSALLTASIPNADQTTTQLTSLYRHDAGQTVALVNANPTTQAILDSWSHYEQELPLAECVLSDVCTNELIDGFTLSRQESAQQQLQKWLAPAWETERDPFSDPYVADPDSDWLDDLHDHLKFEATEFGLDAVDNDGDALATLDYDILFDNAASVVEIGEAALEAADEIEPVTPQNTSPIVIDYSASPANPLMAPVEWQVDVSASRSLVAGDLFFQHTLVGPNGQVTSGSGALFSATLSDPGPYTWAVVVTDSENNRATTGLALQANTTDTIADPSFGAEGTCFTSPLTGNASNICISTVDGGSLGACIADNGQGGSIQTQFRPAPCSPVSQHEGVFVGTCTSVFNQTRIYHYDNPLRNTGETIPEQQARLQGECLTKGSTWSAQPPE